MYLSRIRLALTLGLVTCSKADDGSGLAFAPIEQLDAVYQQAYCMHLVTCGEFPDQATCLTANVGSFPLMLDAPTPDSDIIAAVLAGSVIYNGNTMQQCIDELTTQTCDTTDQDGRVLPLECTETLRGTVAAGGACHLDTECISQICNVPPQCADPNGCCAGTCVGDTRPSSHLLAIGQPCFTTYGCVAGAYCDGNFCAPLLSAGASCVVASSCGYGLSCAGASTLTCDPLPTLNQPCPDHQCRDEGTVCSSSTTFGGVCAAVGLAGAFCLANTDCSRFYTCDVTMKQCIPTARIGESCSGTTCFDVDSYCDTETLLCTAVADNGQPCTRNTGCKSGECSSETAGVCVAPTTCI